MRRTPANSAEQPIAIVRKPYKGRGTTWSIEHRFTADPREPFDDGWASVDGLDAEVSARPLTQIDEQQVKTILAGNDSPDIGFDLSINPYRGLRARLHLLLCPPDAQLPEPVARARLRDPHHRQGQCRGAAASRLCQRVVPAAAAEPGLGDRRLPAGGTAPAHHAVGDRSTGRTSACVLDHHEVVAGRARHRSHRADGAGRPGGGVCVGDHTRPGARTHHGATRRGAAPASAHDPGLGRGRHSRRRERVAGHPVPERTRTRARSRSCCRRPGQARPSASSCACRGR